VNLIVDGLAPQAVGDRACRLDAGGGRVLAEPPTTGSLAVQVSYTLPPNLVLLNPPSKTTSTIRASPTRSRTSTPRTPWPLSTATQAQPGSIDKAGGESHHDRERDGPDSGAIVVNVDTLQSKELPVQVVARAAPGWSLGKHDAICPGGQPNPCVVHSLGRQLGNQLDRQRDHPRRPRRDPTASRPTGPSSCRTATGRLTHDVPHAAVRQP